MTLANSKRLLEHYIKTENKEAAKDMKANISKWKKEAPEEEKIKKSK